MLPPAAAHSLASLVTPTEDGIASRILAKTAGGNLTLFAFDAGTTLTDHECFVRCAHAAGLKRNAPS